MRCVVLIGFLTSFASATASASGPVRFSMAKKQQRGDRFQSLTMGGAGVVEILTW